MELTIIKKDLFTNIMFVVIAFSLVTFIPTIANAQATTGTSGTGAAVAGGAASAGASTAAGAIAAGAGTTAVAAAAPGLLVKDTGNLIQNTITAATNLKQLSAPIFWALSKATLQSVVKSTVNWINSGFKGSPAFATNLTNTLQSVGDAQANLFLKQLSSNSAIKSPFQNQVYQTVSTNYFKSTGSNAFFNQNPYTLNKVTTNDTAFLAGATTQGGLNAWLSAVMNPQNNPLGAQMLAENALKTQVVGAQNKQTTELNWGQGFLSYKGNCTNTATASGAPKTAANTPAATSTSLAAAPPPCFNSSIQTPGTVINSNLVKLLGSSVDTLVSARDFDEIVNALLGQLMNKVLGSGGLLGLSQSSASTGGTSYFDQPDGSQTSINSTLNSNFTQTLNGQLAEIKSFQSNWTIINNAALAARTALLANACAANQSLLASTVQPTIDRAARALSASTFFITQLTTIQGELPAATDPNAVVKLGAISTDYTNLLATTTPYSLPTATDLSTAAAESSDTGTSTPASLFTQMNRITSMAPSCQVPVAGT